MRREVDDLKPDGGDQGRNYRMRSRDARAEKPGADNDRQGRERDNQTGHDEGACTTRREPVSQDDRPYEHGGQERAANAAAPFPGDDPIMAEHAPGRL